MALQTLSDEDLEQLCIGPGGDEADSQPVGGLSFEEVHMLPWTDTPRGRSVPERRLPHGASSTAPAALGGTHHSDAPYAQPRETLDDIARAHHSAAWHEFRAAIDATWEEFTVAHATARGTHNPNMIGDMPNAQDAASASPKLLLGARRPPPTPKAFAALGTPLPPRQAAPRRGWQGAVAAVTPSPPLVLAGAAPQPPPHAPTAGSEITIDEAIKEMTRRSSPRRTHGALSTEAIDQAIAAHPRVRARSPQPATAAEARRLAAHDVAHRLTTHDSQYALCPDRPSLLHGIVIDATEARDAGIPHGTAGADEWGFKWVKRSLKRPRTRGCGRAPSTPQPMCSARYGSQF